jgi:predicted nucleic acid-binding protein
MTEKLVIDAHAWIEYLTATNTGAKIKTLLEKENTETFTCAVTLAEVISKIAREQLDTEYAYAIVTSNSEIVDADDQLSKQTGILHAQIRKTKKDFGLADAYVLATARLLNARILAGDPHFKNIKEAIMMTNNPNATKPASISSGYETKSSKTPKTYPHHKPLPKK